MRVILILVLVAIAVSVAHAQLMVTDVGEGGIGSSGPPPAGPRNGGLIASLGANIYVSGTTTRQSIVAPLVYLNEN